MHTYNKQTDSSLQGKFQIAWLSQLLLSLLLDILRITEILWDYVLRKAATVWKSPAHVPTSLSFLEHIVTKCFLCIKNSGGILLGTLRSSVMESWADESYPLWAALLEPWEINQPEVLGSVYFSIYLCVISTPSLIFRYPCTVTKIFPKHSRNI